MNSTRSESIESDLSASSPVTKQLEAVDGGLKFVKGDNIDLNNPRTYIKSNSECNQELVLQLNAHCHIE